MHHAAPPRPTAARVALPESSTLGKVHSPHTGGARAALMLTLLGALSLPAWAQAPSPCTYFDEAAVRLAFKVPAGQAMSKREGATCRFEWSAGGRSASAALNLLRSGSPRTLDVLFVRMRDGFTQEVRGKQITVAPKQVQWVEGVGEKAFWNTDLNQLAVATKDRVFYVTVQLDGLSQAEKIATSSAAAKAVIGAL